MATMLSCLPGRPIAAYDGSQGAIELSLDLPRVLGCTGLQVRRAAPMGMERRRTSRSHRRAVRPIRDQTSSAFFRVNFHSRRSARAPNPQACR